ncbi:hypothetical protein [Flavobacterium covae]|uniref:hypothetical protein n=1 Tax=Flavobacterium covae TaxID=2906076 RepID=UPI000745C142|nr:hypothetical protein [Flavobacterium covae]AMA48598.1 hypothetical protein AWN65_03540 [Flavobacterium covae]MCJ1810188.1 hypothetical protein [Flavobacterium covae]
MDEIVSLEDKIIINLDKILFREAVNCLKSKTYRAGYIIAWISIVESLKRKINALANTGDIQATQSFKKIEKLEEIEKSADIQIIEEAKTISIIEPEDYKKLLFFWSQRCLFAHPYEKEPNADELTFIIKQSIDISLGKKLEFKKNYVNDLIENLINKPHFLSNDNLTIETYAKKIIPRINKDLHSYFYKSLIAKIGENKSDDTKKIILKRLRIFSNILLKSTTQSLNDGKWRIEDLALNHTYEFVLGSCDYRVWKKIPKRAKELVLEYIIQQNESAEKHQTTILISKVYKKNLFTKALEIKFEKHINKLNIIESFDFYKNEEELYKRFLIEFDSNDFYRQQDSIRILKSDFGQTFQNKLNKKLCLELGRRITKAAEMGCFDAKDVMFNINYRFSENFTIGIYIGLFITKDYKFKYDEGNFLKLLPKLDECNLDTISSIKDFILDNHVKEDNSFHSYYEDNFESLIEKIKNQNKYKPETISLLSEIIELYKN